MQKIILASQSPRRKQLLEWAEVPFEIVVQPTAESFPADLPINDVAVYIAKEKLAAVKKYLAYTDASKLMQPILAADTVVVLYNDIIGKPVDKADAINILTRLSGNVHTVITGVVIESNGREVAFSENTEVIFHELTPQQIDFYVDKYKPYDKAGAYAIQEWIGVVGIKSIKGDFYNVMGLPVSRVVQELARLEAQAVS